jgi:hypothetical protein
MFPAFDMIAQETAQYHFRLDRDETDSYSTALVKCAESREGAPELAEADLLCLLPSGSSWRHALAQRSLYGMTVENRDASYTIVGKEEIVPHPTRGAYPVVDAYLFEDIRAAARYLTLLQDQLPAPQRGCLSSPQGVIQAASTTPDEHRSVEAAIIEAASRRWSQGSPFLFRTLILSDSPFRIEGHPRPMFFKQKSTLIMRDKFQPFLMATMPECLAPLPASIVKWATSASRRV